MQELKKINILSVLRISVLFGLFIGIFLAVYIWGIYSFAPQAMVLALGIEGMTFSFTTALGIIFMQLIFAALIGTVVSVLYNLSTKWVGGIKVELISSQKSVKTSKKK